MGGRCEQLIVSAVRAVEDRDVELAHEIEERDRQINAAELAVDDLAVRILALRQPVGRDLRFLMTALKVVVDLERIGDEAVNIAERAALPLDHPELRPASSLLPEMGRHVQEMLRMSLDAFVDEDPEKARRVLAMDDAVDHQYPEALTRAMRFMTAHPESVGAGMGVASCAKYLERVADHCTNIAEMVVFMVDGIDVRHGEYRTRRD